MFVADAGNLRLNATRDAIYHTMRRGWLERLGRACNFLVILLGAGATGAFFGDQPEFGQYSALAVTVIGALQLVFDFGGGARTHQLLQREYFNLLAEIEEHPDPDEPTLRRWAARMRLITAEEPPQMQALQARAYNAAYDTLAMEQDDFDGTPRGDADKLRIPLWHRWLANIFAFEGASYAFVRERPPRAASFWPW